MLITDADYDDLAQLLAALWPAGPDPLRSLLSFAPLAEVDVGELDDDLVVRLLRRWPAARA